MSLTANDVLQIIDRIEKRCPEITKDEIFWYNAVYYRNHPEELEEKLKGHGLVEGVCEE